MPVPASAGASGRRWTSTIAIPSTTQHPRRPVRRRGTGAARAPAPEDLGDLDHDHYGGRAAVEALARRAAIAPGQPASSTSAPDSAARRASSPHRFGCRVTALDLNHGPLRGRRPPRPPRRPDRLVRPVRADAQVLPFRARSLHGGDQPGRAAPRARQGAVLAECAACSCPAGASPSATGSPRPAWRTTSARRLAAWMAAVDHPEHRGLPRSCWRGRASPAWRPRISPRSGSGSSAALRHVPEDARGHGGAPRRGALRGIQPALRVLRGARGGGEARRRAVQRNSSLEELLDGVAAALSDARSGSPARFAGGPGDARLDLGAPLGQRDRRVDAAVGEPVGAGLLPVSPSP